MQKKDRVYVLNAMLRFIKSALGTKWAITKFSLYVCLHPKWWSVMVKKMNKGLPGRREWQPH